MRKRFRIIDIHYKTVRVKSIVGRKPITPGNACSRIRFVKDRGNGFPPFKVKRQKLSLFLINTATAFFVIELTVLEGIRLYFILCYLKRVPIGIQVHVCEQKLHVGAVPRHGIKNIIRRTKARLAGIIPGELPYFDIEFFIIPDL